MKLALAQPDRKRYVQITETGPMLYQSNAEVTSANTISTHEIDEAIYNQLLAILQTGELDNAKVKEIIGTT